MGRKILMLALLVMICTLATNAKSPKRTDGVHRVMTCNIRITGLPADDKDGIRWDDRKQTMVECIRKYHPDIIMMQEVIYDSYDYCKKEFKEYFPFGFEGPEMDKYTEGYHFIGKNVIFFRRDRYELVSAGCYWLSETPELGGSISWGTNRARHCNWVRVKDKRTGKVMRLMDLHLDHKVQFAKEEQAKLVVREAAQYGDDFPQILCGDFNSKKGSPQVRHFMENGWHDAYDELHEGGEFGYTAHGFKGDNRPYKPTHGRIDYIMTHGKAHALSCEVLKDCPNGIYPSDHYFMLAEIAVE